MYSVPCHMLPCGSVLICLFLPHECKVYLLLFHLFLKMTLMTNRSTMMSLDQTWGARLYLACLWSMVIELVCFTRELITPNSCTTRKISPSTDDNFLLATCVGFPLVNLPPPVYTKTSQDLKVGCRITYKWLRGEQRKSQLKGSYYPHVFLWWIWQLTWLIVHVTTAVLKLKALKLTGQSSDSRHPALSLSRVRLSLVLGLGDGQQT